MELSPDVEYKELRTHLRFLIDKIDEAFNLFIKLATAIIGADFFLYWKLETNDTHRHSLAIGLNALLFLVGVAMSLIIINTLFSWHGYRKALSKRFTEIPFSIGPQTFLAELLKCIIIICTIIGFAVLNPL